MTSETAWETPRPLSTHEVRMDDGAVVTLRRHGNPDGPRVVLSHGNGLAIDVYYPFWSLLADDFDLIVYDQRNHGWNPVGPIEGHNIPTLMRDHDRVMEEIDARYTAKPRVGVFHSVAALVTLLSPAKGAGFAARVLFDPPLCKPGRSYEDFEAAATRLASLARQRTDRFRSREEMAGLLRFLPAFSRVASGTLYLYAEATLREAAGGGGYELRCPREYEAQIVEYAGIYAVLVDFETVPCPTKVIGADPILPSSYLPTLDLSDIISVDYDFLPEATHFLQLEQPEECAEAVRGFLRRISFG